MRCEAAAASAAVNGYESSHAATAFSSGKAERLGLIREPEDLTLMKASAYIGTAESDNILYGGTVK